MFSLFNRVTTTFLLSLLLSGMICLTGTTSAWGQASTPLSPEEVAGQSLKDINGLHYMSRDFATAPDGKPVPKGEDDQWIPDMSLSKPTETKNATQPAPTPNPIQQTGYDPGFRIGSGKQNIVIPPVATTPSTSQPVPATQSVPVPQTSPAPQASSDTNWNDAAFASSKQQAVSATPVTSATPATPAAPKVLQKVFPQVQAPVEGQPSAPSEWSGSFSRPGENTKQPVDMVLSSKEASKLNLA
ncbi:MAG: hypothetical protein Q4G59_02815, partial [Planctomycetia bacterium]|nr:hypothetical protein [Planctomycetia bacterium]